VFDLGMAAAAQLAAWELRDRVVPGDVYDQAGAARRLGLPEAATAILPLVRLPGRPGQLARRSGRA
jgi:hypothetical protein